MRDYSPLQNLEDVLSDFVYEYYENNPEQLPYGHPGDDCDMIIDAIEDYIKNWTIYDYHSEVGKILARLSMKLEGEPPKETDLTFGQWPKHGDN